MDISEKAGSFWNYPVSVERFRIRTQATKIGREVPTVKEVVGSPAPSPAHGCIGAGITRVRQTLKVPEILVSVPCGIDFPDIFVLNVTQRNI